MKLIKEFRKASALSQSFNVDENLNVFKMSQVSSRVCTHSDSKMSQI